MTYSVGGLIQATDYNGFASTTAGANVNDIWSTGSGDKGYGQSALSTVSAAATVTATNWAGLVNNIAAMGNHTNTSITARTAPVTGDTITILAALNTDLTNITTNRGNAVASGTEVGTFSGTTSKTGATGSGTFYENLCEPSCAEGEQVSAPVKINLTDLSPRKGKFYLRTLDISTQDGKDFPWGKANGYQWDVMEFAEMSQQSE